MNSEKKETKNQHRGGSLEILDISKRYYLDRRYIAVSSAIGDVSDDDIVEPVEKYEEDGEDESQDRLIKTDVLYPFVWALRNVNLKIAPGERVGIIGSNGAGKSTLLKIIAGILPPTSGEIHGTGLVMPLFSMLTPINRNITGRENLRVMGMLLGLPQGWMEQYLSQITAFAEVDQIIDQKVCFYPQGVFARLAASTALNVNADIILFDEKYVVGDSLYRDRLQERLEEVLSHGVTLIWASKNAKLIKQLCHRVILLENGEVHFDGPAESDINEFVFDDDNIHPEISIDSNAFFLKEDTEEKSTEAERSLSLRMEEEQVENSTFRPVLAWNQAAERAERRWERLLERRINRKKGPPSNLYCNIPVSRAGDLGSIVRFQTFDYSGAPLREIAPGEDIHVELQVDTFKPGVKVSVRLEFEARLILIFVAEPIVPLIAEEAGRYVFQTCIKGYLYGHNFERIRHKVRTRVLFAKEPNHRPILINATIWLDIRGDIRYNLDRIRAQNGTPATCILTPCPAYIEPPAASPFSEHTMLPEEVRKDRGYLLNRQPLLRPRLEWSVYRIEKNDDDKG